MAALLRCGARRVTGASLAQRIQAAGAPAYTGVGLTSQTPSKALLTTLRPATATTTAAASLLRVRPSPAYGAALLPPQTAAGALVGRRFMCSSAEREHYDELLKKSKKIEAIKLMRETTKVSFAVLSGSRGCLPLKLSIPERLELLFWAFFVPQTKYGMRKLLYSFYALLSGSMVAVYKSRGKTVKDVIIDVLEGSTNEGA